MNKIFLFIVIAALFLSACGDGLKETGVIPIPESFAVQGTTPGGVSFKSTVAVPLSAQRLIDSGIQTQIDRTLIARPAWTNGRSLSSYQVYFIEPMGVYSGSIPSIQGAPILIVGDGRSCAGTNLGTGGNLYPRQVIVLPHQQAQGWRFTEYLENSARYESEHIALWLNNRDEFWIYTGANERHPIFP